MTDSTNLTNDRFGYSCYALVFPVSPEIAAKVTATERPFLDFVWRCRGSHRCLGRGTGRGADRDSRGVLLGQAERPTSARPAQ
jgi:hypothetical protein